MIALAALPALAQAPRLMTEPLPDQQAIAAAAMAEAIAEAEADALPNEPAQEVIPLARPANRGNAQVEAQGEGLITLKVNDADLRQVVAMIAETQQVNVVFASVENVQVTGSLTAVPWRQALETILASTGHTWTDDQGIIVVTPQAAASTIAPRAGGRHVETFELDFAKAVDVDQTVKGLLSPSGQSWILESSSTENRQSREVVAVVDFPANLAQISDYIFQIDQPPRQVLIRANILQVDLKDDCQSGVNLQQLANLSGNQLSFTTVGFANGTAGAATVPNSGATNTSFLQLTGGSLDGLIELLKTTTDAKSLASTDLLTVSGQEARMQSGQQLGFRVTTTTQTSTLESVEFLDVGVVLTMIPQVTRDGRVLLRVKPEVSEGQVDPNTGLPAEDTVEVETDVLLNDGQGLVIGGLIQEIDSNVQSKVPWLGDLPYAGILFQKRKLIKSRAEIIVTLIPHVMPYAPITQAVHDQRLMRTQQPLLAPPLNRFPRPYEAQLPDTFDNPRRILPLRRFGGPIVTSESQPVEYLETTPLESSPTPLGAPELVPERVPQLGHVELSAVAVPTQEELAKGPLCYPPITGSQSAPVLRQATHGTTVTR